MFDSLGHEETPHGVLPWRRHDPGLDVVVHEVELVDEYGPAPRGQARSPAPKTTRKRTHQITTVRYRSRSTSSGMS